MNSNTRPIAEEDFHAYVDGFLDADRRAVVDRYLADHPEAAARLAGWQAGTQALRDAVAWKAREPVPAALDVGRIVEVRLASQRTSWRMAAGIVLALTIGAGSGWMAHGPRMPTGVAAVGMEAAAAYHVFAAADVHAVEFGPEQRAQMVEWASQRFGRPVAPPDLSKAGFSFVGGRRLSTMQGPACMFLYKNAAGARITVFVRPMIQRDMTAPMRPMHDADTAGYVWAHDGLGFGVVTGSPMHSLHQLSNTVRDAVQGGI